MVELIPTRPPWASFRQDVDQGARQRHHDGRVGCNDKLRSLLTQVTESADERQAAKRGHSRLRFVKDVEPTRAETMHRERQKGLAVRYLMQRFRPIGRTDPWCDGRLLIEAFNFSRHIEEAFGS